MNQHEFHVSLEWVGNRGTGTSGYRDYGRQVLVTAAGKPDVAGSAARVFHGDRDRWNPEELLIAALSQCHLLSYLHMAVRAGVNVVEYSDDPVGVLNQHGLGGSFDSVVLRPVVTVADGSMVSAALAAHTEAYQHCFIAQSVNFPVTHEPTIRVVAENLSNATVE